MKEGIEIDLNDNYQRDMYIQQVLSRGKFEDIRQLLKIISHEKFLDSFHRINKFLPKEVRKFWEEGLGDIDRTPDKNPNPF